MTTSGTALDKCHNAGVNEGFEAWRQFVMEWEPKLRTRFVGLLMNVLSYRFKDDIPNKFAAVERLVHDYENQSTMTVDEDIKMGVTMLGIKEHLIRNSVRITRSQLRERFSTTVHRQSTRALAAWCEPEEQGQRQGRQEQGQRQGRKDQVEQEGKEGRKSASTATKLAT